MHTNTVALPLTPTHTQTAGSSADLKHQIEKEVSAEIHRIMSNAQLAAADAKLHEISPATPTPATTAPLTTTSSTAASTLPTSPQKV